MAIGLLALTGNDWLAMTDSSPPGGISDIVPYRWTGHTVSSKLRQKKERNG